MTSLKIIGAACALALLPAGAASAGPAAPMAHLAPSSGASAVTAASLTGSSMAGKRKQRHRTRLDRCNKMPSRC